MKVAIYARVSTDDKHQDPETQLMPLREFCQRSGWEIWHEYIDTARAKDYRRRTSWEQLQKDARCHLFHVVLVYKLDRAFRSSRECHNVIQDWEDRGIKFKALTQDMIDTTTSSGKFMLAVLAAAAEFESGLTSDRVKAGIARTRAQGNRYGRKEKDLPAGSIIMRLAAGTSVSKLAMEYGVSRSTIVRRVSKNIAPTLVPEKRTKTP